MPISCESTCTYKPIIHHSRITIINELMSYLLPRISQIKRLLLDLLIMATSIILVVLFSFCLHDFTTSVQLPLVVNTWPFTRATQGAWDALKLNNANAVDAVVSQKYPILSLISPIRIFSGSRMWSLRTRTMWWYGRLWRISGRKWRDYIGCPNIWWKNNESRCCCTTP